MADLTNQLQAAAGASTGVASDADFENTVLLLHGDGTNGAQNNTFIDSSTNNFTITRNGNTTQGTFTPFSKPDGRWGNYFGATSTSIYNASAALIGATASTFTLEAWIYMTSAPVDTGEAANHGSVIIPDGVYNTNTVYMSFGPVSNRKLLFQWFDGAGKNAYYDTALNLNQWYHVAVVANAGALSMYVDGVSVSLIGTTTLTNRNGTSNNFCVGGSGQYQFIGYTSNVRVTNTAVYTSNFTPSTTPLTAISGTQLLTCQSNRFVDNSSNARALSRGGSPTVTPFSPFPITTAYSTSVNGGAGYFDGSGDYLSLADNAAFTLGSGNFTIELWVYSTLASTLQFICGQSNSTAANSSASFAISKTASNTVKGFLFSGSTSYEATSSGTLILNAWNHIAFVRDGNTARLYINGVQDGTVSVTGVTVNDSSNQVAIGRLGEYNAAYYAGYVSSFRQVVGTCLYTGGTTFTPPTAPLTAITNTSLLCNFTNAGIFDNTGFNALETVGNAQIDTTVKKYGTGSMEFDGNGDYLKAPYSKNYVLSGDFTIEFWLYYTAHGNYTGLVCCVNDNTSVGPSAGWILSFFSTTDKLTFQAPGVDFVTTNTIPSSQWVHIAVVRSGSTITHYTNGVANGTGTSSATYDSATFPLYIAASRDLATFATCFIDDLRITKGIARYTSAFTPPTAAFPDVGD
jgi:hypothetical protein